MHIHATQINPYAALDALRSAQRADAKREAERVRQELLESASELAGESDLSDACIIQIEEREPHGEDSHGPEAQRQSRRQSRQKAKAANPPKQEECGGSDRFDNHLSDWA
jgi:hypothetical protein